MKNEKTSQVLACCWYCNIIVSEAWSVRDTGGINWFATLWSANCIGGRLHYVLCIYIDIPFYDLTITAHLGEQSYRRTLPIIQHSSSLFTKNDNFMFPASTTTNHGLCTKVAVKSLVQKEWWRTDMMEDRRKTPSLIWSWCWNPAPNWRIRGWTFKQ